MASKINLTLPSGQKMPTVGLGTWEAANGEEVAQALNIALEKGYRHIDTAFDYGNEATIGKVIKNWIDSGKLKREDLFITTKLPIIAVHPDRVEPFIKKSLNNLQLDYVDLYLVHCPMSARLEEGVGLVLEPKTDHAAVWKKMEEQVALGRTKNIGLSNYNISQIENILKTAKIKPANLQVELHVYLQQRELVDFCHKNGITVVAYSPLANPGYNKFLEKHGKGPRPLPDILSDQVINKLAKKYSKTPAQIALRFLIQRDIAVVPKSVNPKRIEENLDVFDFNLSNDDMEKMYGLEVGEETRVVDWKVIPKIGEHPDYPFPNKA